MEIGDIFVVNKADLDGANRTIVELEMMLTIEIMRAETSCHSSCCKGPYWN